MTTASSKVASKPLESDRIVVQPLDNPKEATDASEQEGTVLAVGPGVELDIQPGDLIIYSPKSATEANYDKNGYLVISSKDVIRIVEQ